jgi:hypothetical protein
VSALVLREGTPIQAISLAKYANDDGAYRAIIAISKPYLGRDDFRYWYAYHTESDEFLAGGQKSFLLIGCMDRDHGYAIPRSVMAEHLTSLNTTTRATTKKVHYHIHLTERLGKLMMMLPKANGLLDISPYKISFERVAEAELVPA